MRIAVAALLLVAAVAVPLSVVLIPFLTFRHYAYSLPVASSHIHVQNSILSMRDIGLAILCFTPLLSRFAPFCALTPAESSDLSVTLRNLIHTQRTMAEQLALHNLSDAFTISLSLRRASDIAFAYDDLMMLLEDGNRELRGIGDVRALAEIDRASRSLWTALWRITLHVELGLGRLSYIGRTSHGGMKPFLHFSRGPPVVSMTPRLLSRVISISSTATTDSMRHMGVEVESAQVAFSVLLDALHRFAKDNSCTTPQAAAMNICAKISVLWNEDDEIQTVGDQLTILARILAEAGNGVDSIWKDADRDSASEGDKPVRVNVSIIEESTQQLGNCSSSASRVRSIAEAGLKHHLL